MRLSLALFVATALVAVTGSPEAAADAKRVSVGKASLVGSELFLYHTQPGVPGGSDVSVRVGGEPCEVAPRKAFQPRAGGDALSVLFVIDRGGTKRSGMGRYSDHILGAIDEFTDRALSRDPKVRFAIVDTPGAKRPSATLRPTGDKAKIKAFLEGLGGPAGAGADVYGSGVEGLRVLAEHAVTPLRSVVLISDGIDPTAKKGTKENPLELIRQSKITSIPVSSILIDRSRGRKKKSHINGKTTLRRVALESRGVFRTVQADKELRRKLVGELNRLAEDYGALVRTDCKLCGESKTKRVVPVEMVVRDSSGKVIARTYPDKVVELQMPVTKFDDCVAPECTKDSDCAGCEQCKSDKCTPRTCSAESDCGDDCTCSAGACVIAAVNEEQSKEADSDAAAAADVESDTCKDDADCSACGECVEEACEPLACEVDADCPDQCSCLDGGCDSGAAASDAPWLPILAGLLALLAVILLALGAKKRRQAAEEEERRRAEQDKSDAEARLEAERTARIKAEREARKAASKSDVESLGSEIGAMKAKNARVRLTGGPDIALDVHLEPGTYVLGGDAAAADIVVDHGSVSGRHAELTVDRDGGIFLRDLGSTNGTFIEAEETRGDAMPVTGDVELTFGDTIRLSKRVAIRIDRP